MNIYPPVLCLTLLASCGKRPSEQLQVQKQEQNTNSEDATRDRSKLAKAALDSLPLIRRPTAGLAEIRGYDVPVVPAITLENRDISFEIFRCSSTWLIRGRLEEFDPDHPALSHRESAFEFFSANDFWSEISNQCESVKSHHPQRVLTDFTAPSGDWIWYFRPCIATGAESERICSEIFTASTSLNGYQNQYSEQQQEMISGIQRKLQLIAEITAGIPSQSETYLSALEKCVNDDWDKATRALMKSLVLNIIGLGSAIVFEIFAPAGNVKGTWKDRIALIWQPSDDVQQTGRALTRVLLWLFSNQHEFKKTCSQAEEIRLSANANLLRMKSLQYELAVDLDQAERAGIPLPAEVRQ